MIISKLIRLLEDAMDEEGDLEIRIYDSSGEVIEPKLLGMMAVQKGAKTEDHFYLSEL